MYLTKYYKDHSICGDKRMETYTKISSNNKIIRDNLIIFRNYIKSMAAQNTYSEEIECLENIKKEVENNKIGNRNFEPLYKCNKCSKFHYCSEILRNKLNTNYSSLFENKQVRDDAHIYLSISLQ
jgi:hypothetical protein